MPVQLSAQQDCDKPLHDVTVSWLHWFSPVKLTATTKWTDTDVIDAFLSNFYQTNIDIRRKKNGWGGNLHLCVRPSFSPVLVRSSELIIENIYSTSAKSL